MIQDVGLDSDLGSITLDSTISGTLEVKMAAALTVDDSVTDT